MTEKEPYKVDLDSYNGPMDLLLYLIKQEEVDIYDIPIARIAEQYLKYLEIMRSVDPDHIGEFLVLAATLMEIKSRTLLPKPPPEEVDMESIDPRLELVHQLLEYKRFKDAAANLTEAASDRAARFGRIPGLLPSDAPESEQEVDLDHVQIWDLLKAFDKVLNQIGLRGHKHEVRYDDTPIALHADDLLDQMSRAGGSMVFAQVFEGRPKGEVIGLFLALLELVRAKRVRVEQADREDTLILHMLSSERLLNNEIDPAMDGRPLETDSEGSQPDSSAAALPTGTPEDAAAAGPDDVPDDAAHQRLSQSDALGQIDPPKPGVPQ